MAFSISGFFLALENQIFSISISGFQISGVLKYAGFSKFDLKFSRQL